MKKFPFAILSMLLALHSYGQASASDYSILKKRGDSLYRAKQYEAAAKAYSQVLKLSDANLNVWDYNRAAFAWSLNGNADSALFYLDRVCERKEVTFADYLDIIDDRDYKSLHSDSRWKNVNEKIFINAQNSFNSTPKNSIGKESVSNLSAAVFAWSFNRRNFDSAFHLLDLISVSPSLTFEDVQNIVSDGYTKDLRSDARWKSATEKMLNNLHAKYVPKNTFSKSKGNRIMIDEGHNNLHTMKTTYVTLAGVLNAAGLIVAGYSGKFDERSLTGTDLLIISNPFCDIRDSIVARAMAAKQPFRWSDAASKSAYTKEEALVIEQWVKKGGSLFLILDHAPNPKAGQLIAEAFGVEIRNVATYDKLYRGPAVDTTVATTIIFTRSKDLIGDHPIMNKVDSVTTATGSSLVGPAQAKILLHLPPTATDQDWSPETRQFRIRSAAGRTQGIALNYGKGRVVILGEASMISAAPTSLQNRGNWQMTLNILRWLTGNLQ